MRIRQTIRDEAFHCAERIGQDAAHLCQLAVVIQPVSALAPAPYPSRGFRQ